MKKRESHLGEHLPQAKLYLDDLEKIVEIMSEGGHEVKISADGYDLDSLDELVAIKKSELNDVELNCKDPYVSINFEKNKIWLYARLDDAISRGVFEAVKEIVLSCRRPFAPLYHSSTLSGAALGIGLASFPVWARLERPDLFVFSVFWLFFALIWSVAGFRDWKRRWSILIPQHRLNRPNFWSRNSDQLIVALIAAVAGGGFTLIATHLFAGS